MTHLTIALLLAARLQGTPANPQQQPPPLRAAIEGTVVRAGTNEPVSRAQITITRVAAPGIPTTGAQAQPPQPGAAAPSAANPPAAPGQAGSGASAGASAILPVVTESDGKFMVKDLAPGSYRLTAARNGFSKQEYGQRNSRGPGTAITVQAGQSMKDIVFRLTPAGTITGRITDSTGEPLAGITVQLLRSSYAANGKKTFANVINARTNDLGEYRLYWITPGTYYLNANPSGTYLQTLVQAQVNSATSAARSSDNGAAANATASLLEGLLGINTNEVVEPGLALTYYPGTTDGSRAAPINIQPGSELRTIDVAVAKERTFRVQGRVFDSRTGQTPQTAVVQLASKENLGTVPPKNGSYDPASGTFEFRDVAPGEYILVGIVQSISGPTAGIAVAQASASVSANVENLILTIRPGIAIPGQVTLAGATPLSAQPGFERMRVALVPASESVVNVGQPAPIKPDGSFTLDNVSPGEYRVAVAALPPNVYVKEARFGGTNLLQENIAIPGPGPGGFDVTLSPNGGQITGTLVDKDSKPVAATQVVLAPDRQRERRELFKTRATDQNGKFTFQGIPPGDYKIFAWDEMDPFAFSDPEILRQFEPQAKAIKASESSQETVEVKIIPTAQ